MKKIIFLFSVAVLGVIFASAILEAGNKGYFAGDSSESSIVPKMDLSRINSGVFERKAERGVTKRLVRKSAERMPAIKFSAVNDAIADANRAIDSAKEAVTAANRKIEAANRLGAGMRELELREKPYIVRKGDSLWKIAKNAYGDGALWQKIFKANESKIQDPNLIYPKQILYIP